MPTPQDKQFEQNQKLIRHLEEMKKHEYIPVDPIFKSNLRRQIIGQPLTPSAPPIEAIEVTQKGFANFSNTLREKLKFAFKLVPVLLLLFVVFLSTKNLYLKNAALTEEAAQELEGSTGDLIADEVLEPMAIAEPMAEEVAAQPFAKNLESPQINGKGPVIIFLGLSQSEQQSIQEQILKRLVNFPHEISTIQAEKSTEGLTLRIELTTREKYRIWYSREGDLWKPLGGEEE